ncbi:MAG: hypothetical protein ACN4G0_17535 [Polyangiales bacterium]
MSAPGASLLPAAADYGHTNLGWDATLGVLSGRPVGASSKQAALVLEDLTLVVLEDGAERDSSRLAGSTMEQALEWLGKSIADDPAALALPQHEMPAHPLGAGGAFSDAAGPERAELAAWIADATAALRETVSGEAGASAVRCWPHHFDIASLISLDAGKDAEEARSIGVGFSPGDASYDQPYFYVTPWPYPDGDALPPLAHGALWHREGWTGAVLSGERVISERADRQSRAVQQMLGEAITVCRTMLGD